MRRIVTRILRTEELGVILALLLLGTILAFSNNHFLQGSNLSQVARQASYYGMMAVGMVFVLGRGAKSPDLSGTLRIKRPVL